MTANREGFHLSEVSNARLAQRRLRKQRVRSDDSGYLSGTATTAGSGSVSPSNSNAAAGATTIPFLAPIGEPPHTHHHHPIGGAGATLLDPNWNQRKRKLFPLEEERQSTLSSGPSSTNERPGAGGSTTASQSSSNTSYTSCGSGGAPSGGDQHESGNSKIMATEANVGQGVKGAIVAAGECAAEPIMKESFQKYRETPEANRDSIDFCTFKDEVPPPPKSGGKKVPIFQPPPPESGSSSGGD
jgi:hypothetical protein